MSRAARDYATWCVEEPQSIDGPPVLRITRDGSGVSVVTPLLPRGLSAPETNEMLETLLARLLSRIRPRRLVAWCYTAMALQFTGDLAADRVVYDNMDELTGFVGAPPGLAEWEERLLARCDVVFVGGRSLYAAKRHRHDNIHVFPSSVDVAHFRKARTGFEEPDDQTEVARPRLGFFGVIDERMDRGLVARIAALRPDWRLLMIGPTAKIDAADLPRAPDLLWLGCKDYSQLPAYLGGWDVGLMPSARNAATRFISPTKTPEFLAAGVPVVSTPRASMGTRGV
jgi:UDP-galactopyranose mutase